MNTRIRSKFSKVTRQAGLFWLLACYLNQNSMANSTEVLTPNPSNQPTIEVLSETNENKPNQKKISIAPEIALALPQPIVIGAEFLHSSHLRWKAYFEAGPFKYSFNSSTRAISLYTIESGLRYSPFDNFFILGLGLGYRKVGLSGNLSSLTVENEAIATGANLNFSTFYIAPTLGFQFKLSENLKCAFDLGLQVPVFAWGNMTIEDKNSGTDSNSAELLSTDSSTSMSRIAKIVIPKVTLFRLIWNLN